MKLHDYSGNGVEIDNTFTLNGYVADAKATGDAYSTDGVTIVVSL